jgi:hypothetical protein
VLFSRSAEPRAPHEVSRNERYSPVVSPGKQRRSEEASVTGAEAGKLNRLNDQAGALSEGVDHGVEIA